MTATILDGKILGQRLRDQVAQAAREATPQLGTPPTLAVCLVGEDPASVVYVRNKMKAAQKTSISAQLHEFSSDISQKELLQHLQKLNKNPAIHGILTQFPLPSHINPQIIREAIAPAKDVDGLHPLNIGRADAGIPAPVPCTALGCVFLLRTALENLAGLHGVIVGRSALVGRPLARLLLQENATVTVAHSHTRDLPQLTRQADIVVAAVGQPELVRGDWVKQGAVVLDVGISRTTEGGLVGDVAFEEVHAKARALTPVPGGVGPMTVACLLRNTTVAACSQNLIPVPEVLQRPPFYV